MTLNNLLESLKVDINIMIFINGFKGENQQKEHGSSRKLFKHLSSACSVQSFNNCFHKNCHAQANPAQ